MDYLSLLDWWRRQQQGVAGGVPAPAPTPTPFETEALQPLGGIDPRAMENGTPDFSTPGAQADLFAAKTAGFLRDPSRMMPLLTGIGMLAGGGGRSGGAPPQLERRSYRDDGSTFTGSMLGQGSFGIFAGAGKKRRRTGIFDGDDWQ